MSNATNTWRTATPSNPVHVAVDPRSGAVLRDATPAEVAAYIAQPATHPALREVLRVGEVLVDTHTGPGGNADQGAWTWL